MSGSRHLRAWARFLPKLPSELLTISTSYSIFYCGNVVPDEPGLVGLSQGLGGNLPVAGLPMPVLAWLSGKPLRRRVVVASLPILQIALQYVLVHRALEGRLPIGVGLHAVNAALMLLVAIALTLGWPDNTKPCCDRH
jgi:hypothetical protein